MFTLPNPMSHVSGAAFAQAWLRPGSSLESYLAMFETIRHFDNFLKRIKRCVILHFGSEQSFGILKGSVRFEVEGR